jgi:hypothetical protein
LERASGARTSQERAPDLARAIGGGGVHLVMAEQNQPGPESVSGTQSQWARTLGNSLARAIHGFLMVLSFVVVAAAVVALYDTVTRNFPAFFEPQSQYDVLGKIISTVLLIAIAAEIGLLLLSHRTTAAIEVIILVVARKIVSPETTALEILLSVIALCALVIVRSYFLPGRPK